MTNTVVAREAALDLLKAKVKDVTSGLPSGTEIVHVYGHEPQWIPESRVAGVVYRGDGEADGYPRMTFGNQMVALRFEIVVFWPWGNVDAGMLDDYERELVHVDRAIQAALLADVDLGGNVTAALPGDSQTGYMTHTLTNGADAFIGRWLRVPVSLWELEAEAITK